MPITGVPLLHPLAAPLRTLSVLGPAITVRACKVLAFEFLSLESFDRTLSAPAKWRPPTGCIA